MIPRDLKATLEQQQSLESLLLWGPRQVGKTTLLDQMNPRSSAFLDDLHLRTEAQNDPAFFLEKLKLPCLIDEVQYAPNLFPELKLRIDRERRLRLKSGIKANVKAQYLLTGSNRTQLEESVKESLAGRCSIYELHGLSVREIWRVRNDLSLGEIIFIGGFPELFQRPELSPISYLNDYLLSFVEKDLARSSGVSKIAEFISMLRLLAARAGQFINYSEIGKLIGVDGKTVALWMELLQRNFIIHLLPTWATNLSKRVIKMKKLHFYDTGLCSRLQGHQAPETLMNSPQVGALFESLVFSEIAKTNSNHLRRWVLHTWRTKEQNEIDFIIENGEQITMVEAKLGIQSARPLELDTEAKKVFPKVFKKVVVTAGGDETMLDATTARVPIYSLGAWLLKNL